jgi:hypothetical protein
MKLRTLSVAAAGVLALGLTACQQKTEEEAATPPAADASATVTAPPADAMATTPPAADASAMATTPPADTGAMSSHHASGRRRRDAREEVSRHPLTPESAAAPSSERPFALAPPAIPR